MDKKKEENGHKERRARLIVSGLLCGAANGFFGAGGGMLLVPLFSRWVKLREDKLLATSLAVMLPLSVITAVIYIIRIKFDFTAAAPYVVGGFLGGAAAGKLFKFVPSGLLRRIFGIFMIYAGVRAVLS